jgi:hypothetical protein
VEKSIRKQFYIMKAIILALLLSSCQLAAAVDVSKEAVLGKKLDTEAVANRRTILRDLRGDIGIPKAQPRKIRRDLKTRKL